MGHIQMRLQKTPKGTGKSKKRENPRWQYHPIVQKLGNDLLPPQHKFWTSWIIYAWFIPSLFIFVVYSPKNRKHLCWIHFESHLRSWYIHNSCLFREWTRVSKNSNLVFYFCVDQTDQIRFQIESCSSSVNLNMKTCFKDGFREKSNDPEYNTYEAK